MLRLILITLHRLCSWSHSLGSDADLGLIGRTCLCLQPHTLIVICTPRRLIAPVLLRGLLRWLRGNAAEGYGAYPLRQGWMYASLLAVSGFVLALIHHQLFWCGCSMRRDVTPLLF